MISRACRLFNDFTRLQAITWFHALAGRYMISRACSPLQDFPRLQAVTRFPALDAGLCFELISLCNNNLWAFSNGLRPDKRVDDLIYHSTIYNNHYLTWNWNRSGSTYTLSWLVLSGSLPSYQIMLACWSLECDNRPSFQTLSEELFNMQEEEHPYVNVDPSQAFILPPTAGRGMKRRQQIGWRDRPLDVSKVKCIFWRKIL